MAKSFFGQIDDPREFPRIIDCISRDEIPIGIPHTEWGRDKATYERVSEDKFVKLPFKDPITLRASQQFYPVDSKGKWTGRPRVAEPLFVL